MAAPTITDSVIATGTGTSVTTGNLTIASGDVLYVGVILSDGSPGTMTSVTSSGGGGALSSLAESGVVQSFLRLHIWRSTSPTAGTVTITATPAASCAGADCRKTPCCSCAPPAARRGKPALLAEGFRRLALEHQQPYPPRR